MTQIHILEQATIDKIAAGEVVERPGSIVKELCENALDAGASALTVEIRDGGISMIRVTDNGEGIDPSQVRSAFLRHATSKLTQVEDLVRIQSFGFRGEALSSISAVSRVELITKVRENLTGIRYKIEGGNERLFEEVGAPEGSTFIVRDLFYNTPARRKFLKSAQTEAGYINDYIARLALSNPHISVKFMVNSSTRLSTSGFGSQADVIHSVFGRDVRNNLLQVSSTDEEHGLSLEGWIGKPSVSRGNRTNEILYVNGRLVYNNVFSKAVEEGYETFLMQHRFPFVILSLTLPGTDVDVNVHPAKAQVRFTNGPVIYDFIKSAVKEKLTHQDLVIDASFQGAAAEGAQRKAERKKALDAEKAKDVPEPFEELRRQHNTPSGYLDGARQGKSPYARQYDRPLEGHHDAQKIQQSNRFLREVSQMSIFDEAFSGNDARSDGEAARMKPPAPAAGLPAGSAAGLSAEPAAGLPVRPEAGLPAEHADDLSAGPAAGLSAGPAAGLSAEPAAGLPGEPGEEPRAKSLLSSSYMREQTGEADPASSSRTPFSSSENVSREIRFTGNASDAAKEDVAAAPFLSVQARDQHKIIGQLFETYWIVEYRNSMYIIDQHAAHEKVMFERLMDRYRKKEAASQMLSPGLIVTLSMAEETLLKDHMDSFQRIGFEIEPFGGHDYIISAVPQDLFGLTEKEYFMEMLDSLSADTGKMSVEIITMRIATMACKAAVKGNTRLSVQEADALITQLLQLENPYNCPHGRPTIIAMSKSEIEKKFHRIV